jgi:nitroalkane oxidase
MAIDFSLSPAQQELRGNARAFARDVLGDVGAMLKAHATPDARFRSTRAHYRRMVEAGFVQALLPAAHGGTAFSTLDFALAAEELTAVDINVPTTLLATGLGLQPLLRFGSDEQRRRLLPDFAGLDHDRLAALAFTEVTGGANFNSADPACGVRTVARRAGDEWVISGHKHYTTNGSGWDGHGAHLYAVLCRSDLGLPPDRSLVVIMVPGTTPGIRIRGHLETMGQRAVDSPVIDFDEVRVPQDNLVGHIGQGAEIVEAAFSWTAALIGAACVGVMRSAFDCAWQFARRDHRSGPVPVIEYQNAGYMLADLKCRIEAARYLTWKACDQFDKLGPAGQELAIITKIHCSELCVQVVYDAMRLVGVDSYTDLHPLAGLMQDALCFPLYDGGNMGVRRRQLHRLFKHPDYDPLAAAEGRAGPP